MAINLLELPILAESIKDSDYLHIRSTVTTGPNAGSSLDFRVSRYTLFNGYLNEADVNNSIGGIVQLIDDGAGNAALPAVSAAFLTNIPLPTATGSVLGGVRLLDSTTSTSGAGGGYAATPLSVRTVDLRVSNLTAAQVASTAGGTLAATNVQAALNELRDDKLEASNGVAYDAARLGGQLASTFLRSGIATASQVVNVPANGLAATNVQLAIDTLQTGKLSTTGTAANSSQLGGIAAASYLRSGVATASQVVNTPANGIVGATVQLAIDWLGANKLNTSSATAANITAAATTTTASGSVQSALAELASEKLQISDATATNIVNAPNTGAGGTISAINVQTALNGLDTSKLSTTGTAYDSARLGGNLASTFLRSGVATAANILASATSTTLAGTVQSALAELASEKLQISDATAANISAAVTSTTTAGTVQSALEELANEKLQASNGVAYDSARLGGRPASDYLLTTGTPSSAIVVTPYTNPSGNGNIISTNLQSALQELVDEKLPVTGIAADSAQLGGIAAANYLRSGVGTASQVVNIPNTGTGGSISQNTVQAALNGLDTSKLSTTGVAYDSARLGGNLASTFLRSGVATAANVLQTNTTGTLGTTTQTAIDWLYANKFNTSSATAANISNVATAPVVGNTVQLAIDWLGLNKLSTTGTAYDSSRLGGNLASTFLRSGVATAANIVNVAANGIVGTDVQAAINWLGANKLSTSAATAANISCDATSTTGAGTVQAALAELASEKLQISNATATNITCTATSTTAALNVQDALAELANEKLQASNGVAYDSARLGGVLASNYLQSGAVPASGVTFSPYPAGGIGSTTVQAALQELADEKLSNADSKVENSGGYRVSLGWGAGTNTQGNYTVAIGIQAATNRQLPRSVAIGQQAGQNDLGDSAIAIGPYSAQSQSGASSISIGEYAGNQSVGIGSVAIGRYAGRRGQGSSSVAIGDNSGADQAVTTSYQMDFSVAIGANAYTANSVAGTDGYATAVGYAANASGLNSVAFGRESVASATSSLAGGYGATVNYNNGVALGALAISASPSSVSIGSLAIAGTTVDPLGIGVNPAVAVGAGAQAAASSAVAVGRNTVCNGVASVAVGNLANTGTATSSIAIGNGAYGNASSATSVGRDARAQATNSTAIGAAAGSSNTTYTNSTSIGYQATVTGPNQVQLGNSATVVYSFATGVSSVSDIRDKADIKDTELGLAFIQALHPVQYRWDYRADYRETPEQPLAEVVKDGSKKRKRFHNGLIAQEVEQVCANLKVDFAGLQHIAKSGGEDAYSLSYEELIAPMIKAIQELSAQVEELKQQLNKPSKKVK